MKVFINKRKTGRNISDLRAREGMSIQDLANELGCDQETIRDWEAGKYLPGTIALYSMATVFGCRADDIVSIQNIETRVWRG